MSRDHHGVLNKIFSQQFFQTMNEITIIDRLWGEMTGYRKNPSQRTSNAMGFDISWRHRDVLIGAVERAFVHFCIWCISSIVKSQWMTHIPLCVLCIQWCWKNTPVEWRLLNVQTISFIKGITLMESWTEFIHHGNGTCYWYPGICSSNVGNGNIMSVGDLAPVSPTIFRSNSKFDQNWERSSLKYAQPITTKFCSRHDSVTVVMCAKCRWDR